ncbi:sigma-70 family RNA polymerase sigma factor [Oenococcus oeni]|uniref:ComX n=2 Tax=Oenococcus oeni TaxID=1247 RepID=Q04E37_OENOB|nr:sigma-70 family RNA polymerase sigma factor [Oenococcus oeni]ABJ57285.1 ComX [Oenococcus oeni PSU-1]KGI04864.1 competence protein ComX [Oenococcus oeni IOEB_L40_4]KMQ39958.1 competence protein ComX [Oenococcus oeni]KZD14545.1 ComX [Oenococcus oeni]OIK67648.1 competence protein ComX [Oenococcus oeni]
MKIESALKMIKKGDQTGYLFLMEETEGFLRKIHNRYLKSILDFDEWKSEALDVLMRSVDKYQNNFDSKFTTYYFSALQHKAMDLLRKTYSKKEQNRRQHLSLDKLAIDGFDPIDQSWNEAQSKIDFEDAISQVDFHNCKQGSIAVKHLFGDAELAEEIEKGIKSHSLDYRQKRLINDIYKHFYGLKKDDDSAA